MRELKQGETFLLGGFDWISVLFRLSAVCLGALRKPPLCCGEAATECLACPQSHLGKNENIYSLILKTASCFY